MARIYSIPGLPPRRDASRIWMPGDECAHGPCSYSPGVGAGTFANQRILNYQHIFGPQILGRYKLWGPDLVTHVSVLDHPNKFDEAGTWIPAHATTPDAHTLREDGFDSTHLIRQVWDGKIAAGPCPFGVDAAADGRDWMRIRLIDSGARLVDAFFNLATGTVGDENGAVGSMVSLGGTPTVWRCTLTPTKAMAATGSVFYYTSPDGSTVSFPGDTGKGLKLYNATINQTSILTAPNGPTLAARNLKLYGDRYDFTNPNKDSQLVVGADVWNGLPGAIASGANWIACDEMAARYAGEDKQIFVAVSVQSATLGASDYIVGLGNSADNNPHQALGTGAGPNWGAVKDDNISSGPVTNTSATACDGDRHILAWSHDGKTETIWLDGVVTSISAAASDLGAMTVDQVTLFALRKIAAANHAPVIARDVIVGMAANPAQMLTGSNLMRAENPL